MDALILAFVGAIMSWLGSSLINPELLFWDNMNIWFDADIPRVYENMTVREEGHQGTFKHPLFALVIWPPTAALQRITGDGLIAVRLMLAMNAALAAGLLLVLLKRIELARVPRVLAVLLFISSSGFSFWFTVPETFAFGATSILISLFAAAHAAERRAGLVLMVIFGLAALSMTITNFAVFCIALICGLKLGNPEAHPFTLLRRAAVPVFAVLFTGAILAVLQDSLFGDAGLFFNVFSLANETQFIGQDIAMPIAPRPLILTLGAIVTGEFGIAPKVNQFRVGTSEIVQLVMPGYAPKGAIVPGAGIAAAAILVLLTVWGVGATLMRATSGLARTPAAAAILWAAGLSLVFFLLLHMIYGATVFLYAAHTLPLVVILLAGALRAINARALPWLLGLLVALSALHNGTMLTAAHTQVAIANFGP